MAKADEIDTGQRRGVFLDGPAIDHTIGDTRAAILRHLRDNPGSQPREIAPAVGVNADTVRRTCSRMHDAGQLTRDATGRYFAPHVPPVRPPALTSPNAWDTGRTALSHPTHQHRERGDTTVSKPRERLTIAEVCAELKISRSTFYEWKAKGRAPRCHKLPNGELRITREDLEAWFDSCEVAA